MALENFMAAGWPILLCLGLIFLQVTGALAALARRPAAVLLSGLTAGFVYRAFSMPAGPASLAGDFADLCLAVLVFAAALQFRLTRIKRQSPATLHLAVVAGPAYAVLAALSAYVLLPSLSIWSCLVTGAALMLNGSVVDRKTVMESSVPASVKAGVSLESAVMLALGLPLVVILEAAALTPSYNAALVDIPVFDTLKGFATGGIAGLAAAVLYRRGTRTRPAAFQLFAAAGTGLAACIIAWLAGGHVIMAAFGAGLMWSEEAGMSRSARALFLRVTERCLVPVTCLTFGFILGPRILQADILVILFAVSAVTLLRVIPRLLALKSRSLPDDQQAFLAWFGGAPGIATALCFLHVMDSPLVSDQESILTIGATCVLISVLGTRLSSRPLAKYFVRQSALARKRQFYAR